MPCSTYICPGGGRDPGADPGGAAEGAEDRGIPQIQKIQKIVDVPVTVQVEQIIEVPKVETVDEIQEVVVQRKVQRTV